MNEIIKNGHAEKEIMPNRGEKGQTGQTGQTGQRGDRGDRGDTGNVGAAGVAGTAGSSIAGAVPMTAWLSIAAFFLTQTITGIWWASKVTSSLEYVISKSEKVEQTINILSEDRFDAAKDSTAQGVELKMLSQRMTAMEAAVIKAPQK